MRDRTCPIPAAPLPSAHAATSSEQDRESLPSRARTPPLGGRGPRQRGQRRRQSTRRLQRSGTKRTPQRRQRMSRLIGDLLGNWVCSWSPAMRPCRTGRGNAGPAAVVLRTGNRSLASGRDGRPGARHRASSVGRGGGRRTPHGTATGSPRGSAVPAGSPRGVPAGQRSRSLAVPQSGAAPPPAPGLPPPAATRPAAAPPPPGRSWPFLPVLPGVCGIGLGRVRHTAMRCYAPSAGRSHIVPRGIHRLGGITNQVAVPGLRASDRPPLLAWPTT
jgi:hypothetical protein